MKYTRIETDFDGRKVWRFNPPADAKRAKVVTPCKFYDEKLALEEIPLLIQRVEDYRNGDLVEQDLGKHSTVIQLCKHYLRSKYAKQLAPSSIVNYENNCKSSYSYVVNGKSFGKTKITDITTGVARKLYDLLVEDRTVYTANSIFRVLSVIFNYAVSVELIDYNPFGRVKKLKHEPNTTTWTKDQVEKVLDKCYSDFQTRNTGLVIHMCYEWAQRPTDILSLRWENFNWEEKFISIKQSKRGAEVFLPIEEPLYTLLEQQHEEWGFQEWVVPWYKPDGTVFKKMSSEQLRETFQKVREELELPEELKVGTLRKTGIMEMVEAGVDATGIMQVSGHKSISSLNPYMKHTLSGSKSALTRRRESNGS